MADALGWRRFDVVGHDWGGAVAWVVASVAPARVTTLTVLSTPHFGALRAELADVDSDQSRRSGYFTDFSTEDAAARLLADDAAGLRNILAEVPSEARAHYLDRLGTEAALGAALKWYRASFGGGSTASPGGTSPATGSSASNPTTVRQVVVPTLYVWGRNDGAFGRAAAEATADFVSGPYQFEEIEAGHWLPETAADRIDELLLAHLERSYQPGRLPAESGGDALRRLERAAAYLGVPTSGTAWALRADYSGWRAAVGQSYAPGPPWDSVPVAGRWTIDGTRRARIEEASRNAGGTDRGFRQVLGDSTGWHEWSARAQTILLPSGEVGRLRARWEQTPTSFLPHALVGDALRPGASPESSNDLVHFTSSHGAEYALAVADDGRVTEALVLDSSGAEIGRIRFRWGAAGLERVAFSRGAEMTSELEISGLDVFGQAEEGSFRVPEGTVLAEHPPSFQPERLADGVYWLRTYTGPGNSYNALLVEQDSGVVLLEPSLVPQLAAPVRGIAASLSGGRPVGTVVVTHHHADHLGGALAHAAEGATIVTTPDAAGVLSSRAPPGSLRTVEDRTTLGSGGRRMVLLQGPESGHARQMLVAWLPGPRILYVADLFAVPDSGVFPGVDSGPSRLQRWLDEHGIDPRIVVPAHGLVAPGCIVDRSSRRTPCVRAPGEAEPRRIYFVRHAEPRMDGTEDPVLNRAGVARSHALAHLLADQPVRTVWVTPHARARQTGEEVARETGATVRTYDPERLDALEVLLAAGTGTSLVVGHAGTTVEAVRRMGGDPGEAIDGRYEFDRLYLMTFDGDRAASLLFRYGSPSGR